MVQTKQKGVFLKEQSKDSPIYPSRVWFQAMNRNVCTSPITCEHDVQPDEQLQMGVIFSRAEQSCVCAKTLYLLKDRRNIH
jgi:hypothetical protein